MAKETTQDDKPNPWHWANRNIERREALASLHEAKLHLDNVLRGSVDRRTRTLVSTAHDLVREVFDLVELIEDLDEEFE
jgi:hypothetical protein